MQGFQIDNKEISEKYKKTSSKYQEKLCKKQEANQAGRRHSLFKLQLKVGGTAPSRDEQP